MPTLDNIPDDDAPVHLLLIGDTKMGKSTYAAEAAVDGFELIYIDADNGLSALRNRINKENNAADILRRVNYFAPDKPVSFIKAFLRSTAAKPMIWVPRKGEELTRMPKKREAMAQETPDEPIWVMDITAVPASTILCIDSWTALAADSLELLRPEQASSLLDVGADQSLYGEGRIQLVYISNLLQQLHCHVIVQAHSTRYEIWDKPKGTSGRVKQAELTLVETVTVPVSSSRAHGLEMGSRFNHIGTLEIDSLGAVNIDFSRKSGRVQGGPPDKKAKTRDLRFSVLAGGSPQSAVDSSSRKWYHETTIAEFMDAIQAEKAKR